ARGRERQDGHARQRPRHDDGARHTERCVDRVESVRTVERDIRERVEDVAFDRANGLHSIPAALGVPRAIVVARTLHLVTVLALAATVVVAGLGGAAWAGVALAAGLLTYEHSLVRADDLSKLDAAFFTMNGVISMGFLACILVDRWLA
ncbi:MAG: UbiA family prenyltransferase, partial [Gemmatimonadota bacterium]